MKRLVLTTFTSALCAASALAMPTQAELKKAQPLVAELMAPAMAEFKAAGAKNKAAAAVKVADKSVEFANSAETEAAKFLLLKGAVNFYVRGESYDKAADTVTALQTNVKDVTPETIAEITGKATGKISETKAPRLFAQYRAAKLQVRASTEAKSLAKKLKTVKSDALQRRYAEALAVSGDWKAAYGEFAKLNDAKLKAVVEAEAKGQAKNAESGEFWWTYEPAMEDADDFFKSHAASFYRKALDAGEITGLKKNIVEQRIAGVPDTSQGEDIESQKQMQQQEGKLEISMVGADPIRFIQCKPGKFSMGFDKKASPFVKHNVTITRAFWMSEAPITVGQYCALMGPFEERLRARFGVTPADGLKKVSEAMGGDMAAVSGVTLEETTDFCKKISELAARMIPQGYIMRLPTDAEWAYAFSCGGKVKEPNYEALMKGERPKCFAEIGVGEKIAQQYMAKLGVRIANDDQWMVPAVSPRYRVKTCRPNDWGFYDMVGLGWERMADTVPPLPKGVNSWSKEGHARFEKQYIQHVNSSSTDPIMVYEGDEAMSYSVCCLDTERPWLKWVNENRDRNWDVLIRLVVGPDLVSEWKAKHGKK